MGKYIAGGIISLLVGILGIYFIITYAATSSDGSSIELALVGAILILAAILCVVLMVRSMIAWRKEKNKPAMTTIATSGQGVLDKNNAMIQEFEQTTSTRQKLRTLQVSVKAAEGK